VIVVFAFVFGSAVLIAEALDDDPAGHGTMSQTARSSASGASPRAA
jgi:hypothetical protein